MAHYGVDYRDRWRGDLSLRRILNLVRHLPPDSNVAMIDLDGRPHWPLIAHIIDDLRIAMTSSEKRQTDPYPTRFAPKRIDVGKHQRARQRKARRLAQIERGEIV